MHESWMHGVKTYGVTSSSIKCISWGQLTCFLYINTSWKKICKNVKTRNCEGNWNYWRERGAKIGKQK